VTHEGSRFYDNDSVFETYSRHRENPESANDTLERPVIDELMGDVREQHVLDLGCGNAEFGRDLLAAGAASYLGVDGSHNMIAQAEHTLQGGPGRAIRCDLEAWPFPYERFTRVCARLVLHYVADLEALLQQVYRSLKPGGLIVFSVEHPVITSIDSAWNDGPREDWVVDRYFDTGKRVTHWMGAEVVKYHRTVEDHFQALRACGFQVESVRESRPVREHFQSEATFLRRRRIPLFLFMAARKSAARA
jgi:SAM-dependent methyltransferase